MDEPKARAGYRIKGAIRMLIVTAAVLLPPLTHAGCACNCDDEMKNYRSLNGEPDSVITKVESVIFIYKERKAMVYFIWGDMASQCCDVIYYPMASIGVPDSTADSMRTDAERHQQFLDELLY